MPASSRHFLDQLHDGLEACELSGQSVLVAVSGGPDSVALWRGISSLADEFHTRFVVAHLNHQLRGADSETDAEWVTASARALGHEVIVRRLDVSGRVASTGETIEEAARTLRYAALIELADELSCAAVATGHNADDQVETILHHLFRGTGLAGLKGMPRQRTLADGVRLVRPMLEISRADVENWLAEIQQPTRCDTSNSDIIFTRNRIRTELLPWLERELNPQVRKAITQLANQAGEVSSWLRTQAEGVLARTLSEQSDDSLRIDVTQLQSEPRCLIREVLLVAWQRNRWPLQSMGFQEWQRLADIVESGGTITLPGAIDVRRRGQLMVLTRK